MLAYFFNYIDRTSVGFAALQMNSALGLSATEFGWGAGIMFASYCLLEVPSNMAMYRFGARRWIARIMITWGLAAAATAFATGPTSFYVIRFLLGVFEAGFFPGVIYFISILFPARCAPRCWRSSWPERRCRRSSAARSRRRCCKWTAFSGFAGWQWMFLLEGIPACLLGVACLGQLADTPKQARMADGRGTRGAGHAHAGGRSNRNGRERILLWALRDIPLSSTSPASPSPSPSAPYGVGIWLPLILKGHGLGNLAIGFVSAIPYFFATIGMLVWAWIVDRSGASSSISPSLWRAAPSD